MQLNDPHAEPSPIRRQLMAASWALLGASAVRADQTMAVPADSGLFDNWAVDSALAYYHESGRIQAIEPIVNLTKTFADGETLDLNATFDVLSGASPNGALPSRQPQTFTSPSGTSLTGRHTYVVNAGAYPVDSDYQDTRVAFSGNWNVPLDRLTSATVGGKFSYEDDFLSITVDVSLARDFNEKNTTVSFGLSNEYDRLNPIGGTPVADSDYLLFDKTSGKTKDGVGALFGVTQVMTRNWIALLNLSLDRFTGYLNDPYKITSVLDASGITTGYVYESRPDQRTRKSAYLENRAAWSQFSAALSLRYMTDNWQIQSDTVELRPRWTLSDQNQYVEAVVRWYRQSAAEFYSPWLSSADRVSEYQSSDERLSAFHAMTYGVKYSRKLPGLLNRPESELNFRFEYYQQTFKRPVVPGELQGLDLLPSLKAILFQVGWRF